MSESEPTTAGTTTGKSKKKKFFIPIICGAAVLLLTAGGIIGLQSYNAETDQRCADGTAAAQAATTARTTSVDKATQARSLADSAKGYNKADGAEALIKNVDSAKTTLGDTKLSTECSNRDDANTLKSSTEAAVTQATQLDDATAKLSAGVTAFQEAETKRVAAEKKAADEKAAADSKSEAESQAAKKAEEDAAAAAAAAQAAPEAQPQYDPGYVAPAAPAPVGGGGGYVPAPAPASVKPAPAPAPAPAGGSSGGVTSGRIGPTNGGGDGGGYCQTANCAR